MRVMLMLPGYWVCSSRWELVVGGHCSQRTMDLNDNQLTGYCFPKVFFVFSSPSPSDSTNAGGWLHHGGGYISRAVVGTGSWEEFMLTRSPYRGLPSVSSPLLGFLSPVKWQIHCCVAVFQIMHRCLLWIWEWLIVLQVFFLFKYWQSRASLGLIVRDSLEEA